MRFFASLDKRRWGMVLATLALAFLCGHIMQTVLTDGSDFAIIDEGPDAAPELKKDEEPRALPVPPAATLVPILQRPPVLPERVGEPHAKLEDTGCTPRLAVDAAPAATVRIQLEAPCHAQKRVLIRQGNVAAWAITDADGALLLRMPALSGRPVIKVALDGRNLVGSTNVPDADAFRHVAILWSGEQALRINAYEFGAQKSQFGHVWSGAPKSPSRAARGSGGFMTRLGDGEGEAVEIYSFPAGQSATRGIVRLVVEAETTDANCGVRIHATALQSNLLGELSPTEVTLNMPDCDRVGEIVRLQNLFQDMRLAGR